MTRRYRLALLGYLAVAIAAACFVYQRGGVAQAFGLAPRLDRSTPAAQNGYTLAYVRAPRTPSAASHNQPQSVFDLWAGTPDAVGLWITSPHLPPARHYSAEGMQADASEASAPERAAMDAYRRSTKITGIASNGDTFPLPWGLVEGREGKFLWVHFPDSYSGEYKYIDVSLADGGGRKARWRVAGLPRMVRALPRNPTIVDKAERDGIEVTAEARWWRGRSHLSADPVVHAVLPKGATHRWELCVGSGLTFEWERPGRKPGLMTSYCSRRLQPGSNTASGSTSDAWRPYTQANRYCRFPATLRQYETHEETVTFRNVVTSSGVEAPAQMVVTPSGLRVTMMRPLSVGTVPPMRPGGARQSELCLKVEADGERIHLPECPLDKRYHLPVSATLSAAPPLQGWEYGRAGTNIRLLALTLPKGSIAALKELPIQVTYRVDLKTYPMTFTVPITEKSALVPVCAQPAATR